jgi:hypothetical protein
MKHICLLKAMQCSVISGDVDGSGETDDEDAEKRMPTEDGSVYG